MNWKTLIPAILALLAIGCGSLTIARGTRVASPQWRVTYNELSLPSGNKPGSYEEGNVRRYWPKKGYRFVYAYGEAKNLGKAPAVFSFDRILLIAGGKEKAPLLVMGATSGLTADRSVTIKPGRYVVRELVYAIPFADMPEALVFKESATKSHRTPIKMLPGAKREIAGWKKKK